MASYGTVDQLRIRIQMTKEPSAAKLTMLEDILEAASRNIDRLCRRAENGFISDVLASQKYFTADGKEYLQITECTEITEVAVKDSLTATSYTAWTTPTSPMAGDGDWIPCRGDPESPIFGKTPYNLIIIDANGDYARFLDGGRAPVVRITAKWGPTLSVPSDIREACLMQSARWYKEFQGTMDGALASDELGRILYKKGLSSSVQQILFDGGYLVPLYGAER